MYILKVFCGRNLIKTIHYNSLGIDINADIAFHTSVGLKVEITFQDVE